MVGCVVDPFLDGLAGRVVSERPSPTEILPVDTELHESRVDFLEPLKNIDKLVMDFSHILPSPKESFQEIFLRIVALDRNLLGQEIRPPAIPDRILLAMD